MKPIIILVLCALVSSATAKEWVPSDAFLRAVCIVESSGGKNLSGDGGRSLGRFQMSEAAWLDINDWRRARGLRTYSYAGNVMNARISQTYASNYFTILHTELFRTLRRPPTAAELYASYNIGLGTFAECGFKMSRVNSMTRGKCRLIESMVR